MVTPVITMASPEVTTTTLATMLPIHQISPRLHYGFSLRLSLDANDDEVAVTETHQDVAVAIGYRHTCDGHVQGHGGQGFQPVNKQNRQIRNSVYNQSCWQISLHRSALYQCHVKDADQQGSGK